MSEKIRNSEVFRFSTRGMDTRFEVIISRTGKGKAQRTARQVIAKWHRLHKLFNRFDPKSEITRINRAKPGQEISISEEVYSCLESAEQLRIDTDGAFDIDMISVHRNMLEAEKKTSKNGRCSSSPKARNSNSGRWQLEQSGGHHLIRILNSINGRGVNLDLGGIGKGFALDAGREIIEDEGIENALLIGGASTVLAMDTPGEGVPGWLVSAAEGWDCAEIYTRIWLRNRALSSSGTKKRGPHIQDPRTGEPACGHLAAWASHPLATVADALSTAFMVMDTEKVETLCNRDINVSALVIKASGACRVFNPEFLF